MGGRGTYAVGNNVEYTFETIDKYNGVKILKSIGANNKSLPEESHSSNMYLHLHPDGKLHMLRIYNDRHNLVTEIAYHREHQLTGNKNYVLHMHNYTETFERTPARYLTREEYEKYKPYLKGMKWYDEKPS